MIEALVILRIASDYFWEYKAFSVASAVLAFAAAIIYFSQSRKSARIVSPDILLIAFLLLIATSEAFNQTNSSPADFAKFAAYLLLYIAGRIGPIQLWIPARLGIASLAGLFAFATAAFMGVGYQYWGSVATFSGGYFFKTDMALSALILLALVASTLTSRFLLLTATLFALYIVFKTNARIALPLTLAIPVFAVLVRGGHIQKLNTKTIAYIGLAAGAGMGLFLMIDFRAMGLLAFDFSDPFSAANTQGRTVIWSAVLEAYMQTDPLRKLIGSGLGADSAATAFFSESTHLEGTRAHNSYLYLLLCTGIAGSTFFLVFLFSIIRRLPMLLQSADMQSLIIANLFASLMLTFLWTSLTTEIIIRPQLMVLVFYFSGILVQRNLYLKKLARAYCVENSSGA